MRTIPVIDFAHYTNGTPSERERFVRTYGDALKEFGFATITNHAVNPQTIRDAYADAEAFFGLPVDIKSKYLHPTIAGQRGYTPFGKEHAKNRKIGDLKEFYHVGREFNANSVRKAHYGDNIFPGEVNSFRKNTLSLFQQLDDLSAVLLTALADYFAAPKNIFSDMALDGNSVLRIIHYPPLREMFMPGAVRAAEHEDINLITLLCEGTSSGLELLTREGEWMSVDTLKGQIVVDSGDMLTRVTNGIIPATTHRVVNPPSADLDSRRYSMPFFVHPYSECMLDPIPQTLGAGPKFKRQTADQYLQERLAEIGLAKAS